MRSMQEWLDSYSADHRNPANQVAHWLCVPPIVWAVIAMLWTVPVPESQLRPGAWAVMVIVLSFYWYWKHSHRLAVALLVAFAILALITHLLALKFGMPTLLRAAIVVFVVAWVGQFIGHHFEGRRPSFLTDLSYLLIGHHFEGRRPSFLTDLSYLLIGPAWLMTKLLRRLGVRLAL